jgi:hypothetical protein
MRRRSWVLLLVLVVVAFVPSGRVRAGDSPSKQDRGAFVGFSAGSALWHHDFPFGGYGELDDEDLGWKLFAGYQLTRHFALGGEWVDFGQLGDERLGAEASGSHLVATGLFPVAERHVLWAQLGLFAWNEEYRTSTPQRRFRFDRSGTSASLGIGYTGYVVGRRLGLRVEWVRFFSMGTQEHEFYEPTDRDLVSLGVIWNFR